MTSRSASSTLQSLSKHCRRRCQCTTKFYHPPIRLFTASSTRADTLETEPAPRPRWAATPPKMKAPVPYRIRDPAQAWEVNEDPARLDRFYNTFLGRGGSEVLTEEVKWLAVTHKSFDQGRRGFNDRLAFYGRRILEHQTMLSILYQDTPAQVKDLQADPNDDREPFDHPALRGLNNLNSDSALNAIKKKRLARLASQLGMTSVLRWKPRTPSNLEVSGVDVVLVSGLYAVIGAVALERGGHMANRVAKERVLKPLGLS